MTWVLCTSGAATAKAGANANISGALIAEWSNEVEGTINTLTRRDWITNPPTAKFSGALADLASDMIAMKIINFDMGGFTSRLEASTMLDVLRDNSSRILDALKEDKIKEIIV